MLVMVQVVVVVEVGLPMYSVKYFINLDMVHLTTITSAPFSMCLLHLSSHSWHLLPLKLRLGILILVVPIT